MKVKDLIEKLSKYPDDMEVCIPYWGAVSFTIDFVVVKGFGDIYLDPIIKNGHLMDPLD